MADYLIQESTLDAIARAINDKAGTQAAMTPAQMVAAIGNISGGGGTDRLKNAQVTLAQDYEQAATTSASIMALCAAAVGTANYVVQLSSTSKTKAELAATFYGGVVTQNIELPTAVVNWHLEGVVRIFNEANPRGPSQWNSGLSCGWAGDVYQVWGWD